MRILENHGFSVTLDAIKACLYAPERIETGYGVRKIAQKTYSESHVLRVVYEERDGEILVITVYPGRRSRYEKNNL